MFDHGRYIFSTKYTAQVGYAFLVLLGLPGTGDCGPNEEGVVSLYNTNLLWYQLLDNIPWWSNNDVLGAFLPVHVQL